RQPRPSRRRSGAKRGFRERRPGSRTQASADRYTGGRRRRRPVRAAPRPGHRKPFESSRDPVCWRRMSRIRYARGQRRIHPAMVQVAGVALLLAGLLPRPTGAAPEFHGRVVGVADGDTITVLHDGRPEKLRLYGIDAPEKRQAFGQRAKEFTAGLAFGTTVTVRVRDHDRYRRTVAEVVLPDGRSLNQELVRAGYAWWYRRYSK